jgi:predicted DsbA family dithiol-disulfide isomerase
MAAARDLGVMATPAWWVDDRLLIPGAQPRATVERWVAKLLERSPN